MGTPIYIFSLPYFLASKLEAFLSRGGTDPRQSSDLEEVILVLDGCTDPAKHLDKLDADVRLFVRRVIENIRPDDFREVVAGCLGGEAPSRVDRISRIFQRYFTSLLSSQEQRSSRCANISSIVFISIAECGTLRRG